MPMPSRASLCPDGGDDVLVAGRYRLQERLGVLDGSSSWRAADEMLHRPVMVWTFPPGFRRADAVFAAARAASQLADPRLAQVLDADDEGELPYLVAEWPPGRALGDLLVAGPDEPAGAAAMVAEAAEALAVAHASGLAHLCLRPSSLWRRSTGEVKITGLGVDAALAGIESAEPALADTQGLGQLLYAALTGYWPGTEQKPLPAAPRHGAGVYSPRQVRAGIPGQLDAVARRALPDAARDAGPPIVDPAQLADELGQAVGASSPRLQRASATLPFLDPATVLAAEEPPPVTPAQWSSPPALASEPMGWVPARQPPTAGLSRPPRHPVSGTGWSPPASPARPRGRAR
jgi:serine/threonine protein kinase